MKKKLLFLLLVVSATQGFSQITFEKGYYIDNSGNRREAFIKNLDWKNNPTQFEFKFEENEPSQKATMTSVQEFGFNNGSKYVKKTVNIDRSSEEIGKLGNERNPDFEKEDLFLKVLVEGMATLYQYKDKGVERFFYSTDSSEVEQLVFKKYKTSENKIAQNNGFRQQLLNALSCPQFDIEEYQNLSYKKDDLVEFFRGYNQCYNVEPILYEERKDRDLFNLSFRPRLSRSSLDIQNSVTSFTTSRNFNFGSKFSFGFGVEAEFILPFNKNKWSLLIEPTYRYFKSETYSADATSSDAEVTAKVDYMSIEIPLGLRHYFFINDSSAIFLNASYVIDVSQKSSIDFARDGSSAFNSLEIQTGNNPAFGIGLKHKDRYSMELRWQGSRNILNNYLAWDSSYETVSLILGYSLF